ncbi:MAG: PKD domain-containing protein [Bacteroidetes bacterium]|nr:PKD domain-containing protein [Bacteroidota bacterium]
MKAHVLIVILIALFLNSCNKKALPPKDETPGPVFYFKCDIGGFPVDLKAGVNSYYMKSSYYRDSNNVYIFKGELKQKECSGNCGFGLTIMINDYKTSPTGSMYIDSTLMLTSYQYNDAVIEPTYYTCNFASHQTTQPSSYTWSFSDISTTWGTAYCARTFKANKTYTTSLLVSSQQFGSISHDNVYKVGNPVQTNVNVVRTSPTNLFSYKFSTVNTTGVAPFTYIWDFGDSYTSPDPMPTHEYQAPGLYEAKLTLIDANKDTCISYYQVPAFNGSYGESNFSAYFTPVLNTKALSTISIFVNDPKGNVYSLAQVNQSEKSHFEIISIENYQATDTNQPLKKVKIKFNCTVYNGANSLEIKDGEAVIAIAYK